MFVLLAYWFGLADRYSIFLYGHVDHIGDPPAQPFDALTRTRYVMASFAAAGFGASADVVRALASRSFASAVRPCGGWRAYALTALGLSVSTTALAHGVNAPTLPFGHALLVGAAAGIGFGLAIWWRDTVDGGTGRLAWLVADGAGPAIVLLGWRVVELPERGVAVSRATLAATAVVLGAAASIHLVGYVRVHAPDAPAGSLLRTLAAGTCVAVLGFPMLHHLHTLPAYPYITAAQNVGGYHLATWVQAALIAVIITATGNAWTNRGPRTESRDLDPNPPPC